MPKPLPSTVKQFRVRVDGEADEPVVNFCKQYCDTFLLVHHVTTTENPHYHFYCETKYTQGNFSTMLKKVLGVKGGDYCNQVCDPDRKYEYLSYLFNTKKGNVPRVVLYEGFSVIDVATFSENAKNIAVEFAQKMKDSKKTQYDIAQIVLKRLDPAKCVFPHVVYDTTIEVLKECKMMARPNHVKDIIATVMAYSDNKAARQQVKEITLKFFSQ